MKIDHQNYTEYLLLYLDNELDASGRREMDLFLEQNPDQAEELKILQQATFVPDDSIVFEDKESLLRKEEDRRTIPFGWFKIAVAAMLLLSLGVTGWYYLSSAKNPAARSVAAQDNPLKKSNEPVSAGTVKKSGPPVLENHNTASAGSRIVPQVTVNNKRKMVRQEIITPPAQEEIRENHAVAAEGSGDQTVPAHANPDLNVAAHDQGNEDVKNSVAALKVNSGRFDSSEPSPGVYYENVPQVNDVIYFANTSFSKKTKFRELFRKASRVIEKVTSPGAAGELLRNNELEISTQ